MNRVRIGIDILENELVAQYPNVLEILLRDHTTQKNIFWATKNYEHLGPQYNSDAYILPELITGENGNIIMPRVHKDKALQQSRSKEMAEVFTPAWICNAQNNLIDNAWFGIEGVFNQEKTLSDGIKDWVVNTDKIIFPKGKTWHAYVVPLQDFTPNSDINWSQSIPEIDQQLYKKYNLSEEEIAFIEGMIKPMG